MLVSVDPYSDDNPQEYWNSRTDQIIVTRNKALLPVEPIRSPAQPLAPGDDLRV
jgi:hypothetical protein